MSKYEAFLLQLDALLEVEASARLEQQEEFYLNDVVAPDRHPSLKDLNRAEKRELLARRDEWVLSACTVADRRLEAESNARSELLEAEKRRVFTQASQRAALYLPAMIKAVPTDLNHWARKLLKHYRETPHLQLVKVYLYLNLRSVLEWENEHLEPEASKEDRLKDLAVEGTYDGGASQFETYYSSLSLAVVSLRGDRIVNQDRPDLVVAA